MFVQVTDYTGYAGRANRNIGLWEDDLLSQGGCQQA